ncbi:MAG: hypothetical protein GC146_05475 [Limimaricola sp.]|uniref:hypothetical protein n=1 Tax=Limimaricola sp. TaxID=2211665 RepID=UPI001D3D41BA|nr:hypothetical protein [Limimaricola sp.]MBI1416658.1 hypothetical protein [Limimaricola sp.]
MTNTAQSIVAALCYTSDVDLPFDRIVAEFHDALSQISGASVTNHSSYEDFFSFETEDVRICLCWSTALPSPAGDTTGNCFVISVGSPLDRDGKGALFANRRAFCQSLLQRIEMLYPADRAVWFERDQAFDEDLCDAIVDTIWATVPVATPEAKADKIETEENAAETSVETAAVEEPQSSETRAAAAPHWERHAEDPDALLDKLDERANEEYRRRHQDYHPLRIDELPRPIRPTHPAMNADHRRDARPPAYAFRKQQVAEVPEADPTPDHLIGVLVRDALYAPLPDGETEKGSIPHRLAIYAMNTTLLVAALPVGATMMTYSVLGREDMNLVGRAMALTGIILGLTHTPIGSIALPFIT